MQTSNIFIARQASNIHADIQRGWSSWNFGAEGFKGTIDELVCAANRTKDSEESLWVNGFDIWVESVDCDYRAQEVTIKTAFETYVLRELDEEYWVCVDNENAKNCLSCVSLKAETLEEAIKESQSATFWGDGDCFDVEEYELVHSDNDIHIFKYKI